MVFNLLPLICGKEILSYYSLGAILSVKSFFKVTVDFVDM